MSFDGRFTIWPVRRLERPLIPSVDVTCADWRHCDARGGVADVERTDAR
jgi:hypothetical protein